MANRLSDDELRKALQEYGENVGPITHTTRAIWERRLTSLRKIYKRTPTGTSLNVLSSDDSEIENSDTSRVRKRRSLTRNSCSPVVRLERLDIDVPSNQDDVFKKPSPVSKLPSHGINVSRDKLPVHKNVNSRMRARGKREAAYDLETSDSDLDSGNHQMPLRSRQRKKLSLSESPSNSRKTHSPQNNIDSSSAYYCSPYATDHNSVIVRSNRLHTDTKTYSSNGYLSNATSNGEFHEEKIHGSSTNYSHFVPWALVLAIMAFFLLIGALYMTEVKKTSQKDSNDSVSRHCHPGVGEEMCKRQLLMARDLHTLLSDVAREYECEMAGRTRRNLTIKEARNILGKKWAYQDFDEVFDKVLSLVAEKPEWEIRVSESSALEVVHAWKPLLCRIRLSLKWTVAKLFLMAAVVSAFVVGYACFRFWKHQREVQEKVFYELIEKVIDLLQESPCEQVVVNLRDALIPPADRKAKLWMWDKVVAFIEENESRVSVEHQKMAGEDYKVWRWHPCASPDANKLGKVWQGQAFNNMGKSRSTTYSPTPCLKIRNMFDPEVEYGDDWQVNIQNAILEKCEGNNGIVHIAIDTTNSEGCMYLLCNGREAAGKAFEALHGWWFDGKLVTVKYLRFEKYLERFPDAEYSSEPLKPSNNQRLSLSTPFFSSALERS